LIYPLRTPWTLAMPSTNVQEVERQVEQIGRDLWTNGGNGIVLDGVLQMFLRLQVQVTVQQALERTAKILRDHPGDKLLPNQLAIRVKHFIKFVFEKTTRDQERQRLLRGLEFNALKFCGLCYKIKDIIELPAARFDFLVENVNNFLQLHGLSRYLYRDDINKAVFGDFDPEDDELFKEFLKCLSLFLLNIDTTLTLVSSN
jgi:hypothetical protein